MPITKKLQIALIISAGIVVFIALNLFLLSIGLNKITAVVIPLLSLSITALWLNFIFNAGFDPWSDIVLNKQNKLVALTFDDGPSSNFTEKILTVLKEKKVPASFFVLGKKLSNNINLAEELLKNNCEIGAHTYAHKKLHRSSSSKIDNEIQKSLSLVKKLYQNVGLIAEYKPIFRAPHGFKSLRLKIYTKKNKIKLIPWTRGVWDTDSPGADWIFNMATKNPKKMEIILLHDGLGLENKKDDKQVLGLLDALPRIIDFYKNKGYSFVKVSKFINKNKP